MIVKPLHDDTRQLLVDRTLDRPDVGLLVGAVERERLTGHLGAASATNAMDVILRRRRGIEVHNVSERFDVDSASGDVCRNENAILAALESGECFSPLSLRTVSMNTLGLDSVSDQVFR